MKLNFKIKLLILIIAAALVFSACSSCGKKTTESTSSGVVQPDGSFCLDKTGLITEQTKNHIAERNYNLEDNCSGAQICVVVLNTTGNLNVWDYGRLVFNEWKIGSSKQNNGVLIIMAANDNAYGLIVGTGIEDDFTFDVRYDVLDEYCKPDFDYKNYDAAVNKTFDRMNELLCAKYNVDPDAPVSGYESGSVGSSTLPFLNESCDGSSAADISCNACSSCIGCASCGCTSCGGVGLIIFVLIAIYVVMQILRGMGKTASRTNTARPGGSGSTYRGPGGASGSGRASGAGASGTTYRAGSSSSGFRPRTWMFALPLMMKAARARRPHVGSFFGGAPFGGASRGPRPGGSFGGFRAPTGGFKGPSGGFRGFTGGGGSSRGGGAGRR